MSWYWQVVIVAIVLIAMFHQQQDLVDTRRRLDALNAAFRALNRQFQDQRKQRAPLLPEERRAAIHWPHPKENP